MVTGTDTDTPPAEGASAAGDRPMGPNVISRFTIAGDVVARTAAKLPDRERAAVKWLHGYCTTKNISHRDVAPLLKQPNGEGYSHDSLYHMFVGNRDVGQLANLVSAIERFRRIEEERAGMVKSGFVEDSVTRRIWTYCRKALLRNRVGMIFGESQTGKTASLEEYAKTHNHGETKMFRFPAGGSYTETLREIALMLELPVSNTAIDLRRRIIDCFDSRMLLIADEIMESQPRVDGSIKKYLRTLNFLREIHDRKKCGLILCGTNVFRDSLKHCAEARNLRQLTLRGLPPLILPSVRNAKDLAQYAAAYGLGAAPDADTQVRINVVDNDGNEKTATVTQNPLSLQTDIIKAYGLGRWIAILQEAADIAKERRRPITWGAVITAWDSFERNATIYGEGAA